MTTLPPRTSLSRRDVLRLGAAALALPACTTIGGAGRATTTSSASAAATPAMSARMRAWNRAMLASPGNLDHVVHKSAVVGRLPDVVRGASAWWNGPGLTAIGGRTAHPFDGHGYVRRFHFDVDGSVSLRARFVDTEALRAEQAAGRLVYRGVGTLPWNPDVDDGAARNLNAPRRAKNVANTTLVPWGGRMLAGWEGGWPTAIDVDSLATIGPQSFGGALRDDDALLAHMRVDRKRNVLVGLTPQMGMKTGLVFREIDAQGRELCTTTAEVDGASFIHDFVITQRYYVLARNALDLDWMRAIALSQGRAALLDLIRAAPARATSLLLVRRPSAGGRGHRMAPTLDIALPAPAFVIHYGAAWDEGGADGDDRGPGHVVVDACTFSDLQFGAEFGYRGPDLALDPALPDARAPQRLFRFRIDVAKLRADATQLDVHGIDFPRVHPDLDGQDAPWMIAATRRDVAHSDPFDALLALDLRDLERPASVWHAPEGSFVGEPLWVPAPGGGVDDGATVACVSLPDDDVTRLVVFNGRDLASGPVAHVDVPLLPIAFHGIATCG